MQSLPDRLATDSEPLGYFALAAAGAHQVDGLPPGLAATPMDCGSKSPDGLDVVPLVIFFASRDDAEVAGLGLGGVHRGTGADKGCPSS